jgi:hypothetical protein
MKKEPITNLEKHNLLIEYQNERAQALAQYESDKQSRKAG